MKNAEYPTTESAFVKTQNDEVLPLPRNGRAVAALSFDFGLLILGETLALAGPYWSLRLAGAVMAGTAISTLFILGHDAAHNSLFTSRRLNKIIGRLLFFPCFHNPTLWRHEHNHLHHQETNVKGKNSFSPLTAIEFGALPPWRRWLQRLYRHPLGFGMYYLIERWWKHKFFPTRTTPASLRREAFSDFRWLILWLGVLVGLCAAVGLWTDQAIAATIFWGLVVPFYIWNHLMGLTAFVQHTHPAARWTRSADTGRARLWQTHVTILIRCPRWYDVLSHNIMRHPAHHVSPRSPWYDLPKIEEHLMRSGQYLIVEQMSLKYVLRVARTCKLFDYDHAVWTDFAGRQQA